MTDYRVAVVLEGIDKRLRELVAQQHLANLIALLNPELATWSHVDTEDIVRQVRAFLDGGAS